DLRGSRWCRSGGPEILPGLPLLCAGLSVWLPFHQPGDGDGEQMHSLLSQDHEGTHHSVLRSVPDGHAAIGRSEKPERSNSCIPEDPQRSSSETTNGHPLEVLLLRLGWFGAIRRLPSADSRRRFHVPQRGGTSVECADRPLSVPHRTGGGRLHSGVVGAGLSGRG